jgi:hypothetical protein
VRRQLRIGSQMATKASDFGNHLVYRKIQVLPTNRCREFEICTLPFCA